jgi:hypothetical protein
MARGWESKEVESQIESAQSKRAAARNAPLTNEQIRNQQQRESLEMSRTRVLRDLETVTHDRYRVQLESAFKHLEQKLAELSN